MNLELEVDKLIRNKLETRGFKLIKVKYKKENNNYFLRIIIDKENTVSLDDCIVATEIIEELLDEKNLINNKYILDVCSNEKGGK